MSINFHIEHLVLDGINLTPGQLHLLRASVKSELTRLLNNGDLAGHIIESSAVPRLDASAIKFNDVKPIQLGQKIAQSVYGGIGYE